MGERDFLVTDDGQILVHYSSGNYVFPIETRADLSEQDKKATQKTMDFHNRRTDLQPKNAIADDGTLPPDMLLLRQWYV